MHPPQPQSNGLKVALIVLAAIVAILVVDRIRFQMSLNRLSNSIQESFDRIHATPAERASKLAIGMTREQVVAAIGEPDHDYGKVFHYRTDGTDQPYIVGFDDNGKVEGFNARPLTQSEKDYARDPRTMADSLAVGDTAEQVLAQLGQPTSRTTSTNEHPAVWRYETQNGTLPIEMANGRVFKIYPVE